MSISTGWREQYDRMHRSYERLLAVLCGEHPDARSSDTARDALYHFFEDAYHLKDWIKATSTPAIGKQIEERIKVSKPLSLCADLCNGIKHFRLDPEAPSQDGRPLDCIHCARRHGQACSRRNRATPAARPACVALHIPRQNTGRRRAR